MRHLIFSCIEKAIVYVQIAAILAAILLNFPRFHRLLLHNSAPPIRAALNLLMSK